MMMMMAMTHRGEDDKFDLDEGWMILVLDFTRSIHIMQQGVRPESQIRRETLGMRSRIT